MTAHFPNIACDDNWRIDYIAMGGTIEEAAEHFVGPWISESSTRGIIGVLGFLDLEVAAKVVSRGSLVVSGVGDCRVIR